MKFILGTAQFGLNYGINNRSGIPNDNQLKKILDYCTQMNVNFLDTAPSYGNCEKRIGMFANNRFNIISKFSQLDSKKELDNNIDESLKSLNIKSLYGYLSHDENNIIEKPEIWEYLKQLKTDKKTKKIGFSIYDVNKLEYLLNKKIIPDIIQLPYSVFDRKFEKYLPKLKDLGVEIHARSIFVQGLIFMNENQIPKKLNLLKEPLFKLRKISNQNKIDLEDLAVKFVLSNNYIDKIVFGVDSFEQLKRNLILFKNNNINNKVQTMLKDLKVDQQLINPTNW